MDLGLKHPDPAPVSLDVLLRGPVLKIDPSYFNDIDEQLIHRTALYTMGSGGPSGVDADVFKRILISRNFAKEGKELREEIAFLTRKLLTEHVNPEALQPLVACRLIPINKNPGVRPIGVGEVLRRVVGKAVAWTLKSEIREAAGPLQTCANHGAGAEAAIHSMQKIFGYEETDAVLLIDARNAFNTLNRKVALHNVQIQCPYMSTYLINTYRNDSRLFVSGGVEMASQEGTTQGDPLAMPWYALASTVVISYLKQRHKVASQVWLANDAAAAGKLSDLHSWYLSNCAYGNKAGYHVNASKTWLIVKTEAIKEEAERIFRGEINVTASGQRHLGAVIGSSQFRAEYCCGMVSKWKAELQKLAAIANTKPHEAYIGYTKGYRSKFTYFMRTIPEFGQYLN